MLLYFSCDNGADLAEVLLGAWWVCAARICVVLIISVNVVYEIMVHITS